MSYPIMPFDTEKIKQLRRQLQKTYEAEALDAWIFHRRFSIYITLILRDFKWVTPNLITASGIFFSALGIVFLMGVPDVEFAIIAGFFLYHLAYLFDVVDGELARLRNQTSVMGQWLDKILEGTMNGLVLTIGIRATELFHSTWASGFLLSFVLLRMASRSGFAMLNKNSNELPTTQIRTNNFYLNLLSLFSSCTGLTFFILIGLFVQNLGLFWWTGVGLYCSSTLYQMEKFYRYMSYSPKTGSGCSSKGSKG